MRYLDTRGLAGRPRTFSEAVLDGIAPGGGLYVPERLPHLDEAGVRGLAQLRYPARVERVLAAFEPDLAPDVLHAAVSGAYGAQFDDPAIAPVRDLGGGRFVLELWHGPTLAFKDMALQLMPRLFSAAIEGAKDGEAGVRADGAADGASPEYLILVATSGDTGAAALEGFADREHTRIAVLFPDAGVSSLQERQMTTRPGANVRVFRVLGDFDACQTTVKAVFDDPAFAGELGARRVSLSSANSINWGRLLPQVAYYLSACADLQARGVLGAGQLVDVCVPTGNFGNVLAAWYARRMGAPIGRLIAASNTNNVLADFIATGVYDISARSLVKTPSPSMDILVSSNLERLLFDLVGDPVRVRGWMADLRASERFAVDAATLELLRASFDGGWVDNAACLATIAKVQRERGYLLDPHTAVAWRVADELAEDRPMLIVATAHWSKFAADVTRALTGQPPEAPMPTGDAELDLLARVPQLAPGASVPPQVETVLRRPVRFRESIPSGREALEGALRGWLADG
ncbi:MAG TPA: threonine synthase [Candidatus Limnocylindrales bacterium]